MVRFVWYSHAAQELDCPRRRSQHPVNVGAFIIIVILICTLTHFLLFFFRSRTGNTISVPSVSAGSESAVFLISIDTGYCWLSNTEVVHLRTGTTCTLHILTRKSSLEHFRVRCIQLYLLIPKSSTVPKTKSPVSVHADDFYILLYIYKVL